MKHVLTRSLFSQTGHLSRFRSLIPRRTPASGQSNRLRERNNPLILNSGAKRKSLPGLILTGLFIMMHATVLNAQEFNEIRDAFQKSYLEEASGNIGAAIESLKSVYDEDSYELNLRLGWLSYQRGNFSESLAYYNRAIELRPYAIEPRFGLAYPGAAMGSWNQVIAQYEKILEISPNNSVALHRLGLIYYGREDYEKARQYFEKVVNLYPFDYDGLTMLGWANFKLKRFREAKVLFQKALLNTPSGSSAVEGLDLLE